MNHLLGPYVCRRPHCWSPKRREGKEGQQTYQAEMFPWLQKNIQITAMDSPLFDYVVFYFLLKLHLIEETFVAQKKCAHYKSGI